MIGPTQTYFESHYRFLRTLAALGLINPLLTREHIRVLQYKQHEESTPHNTHTIRIYNLIIISTELASTSAEGAEGIIENVWSICIKHGEVLGLCLLGFLLCFLLLLRLSCYGRGQGEVTTAAGGLVVYSELARSYLCTSYISRETKLEYSHEIQLTTPSCMYTRL